MSVMGYVLVQTAPGKAGAALAGIKGLKFKGASLQAADAVTGPYDLIVVMEAEDLNSLGMAVAEGVQSAEGITRTTTCIAVTVS